MHAVDAVLTDQPQTIRQIVKITGVGLSNTTRALLYMHKHGLVQIRILGKGEDLQRRPEGYFRAGKCLVEDDQSNLRSGLFEGDGADGGAKC
jgi:hypothetical protein